MRRPSKIHVLGQPITIEYCRTLDDGNLGEYYAEKNLIKIKRCKNWREHLLHEVLHCILYTSGHASKHSAKDEEALVLALENGLKNIFLLNPRSSAVEF